MISLELACACMPWIMARRAAIGSVAGSGPTLKLHCTLPLALPWEYGVDV